MSKHRSGARPVHLRAVPEPTTGFTVDGVSYPNRRAYLTSLQARFTADDRALTEAVDKARRRLRHLRPVE